MKKIIIVLCFLSLAFTKLFAQNCNNLTITAGGVPNWPTDPTTPGYACGGRVMGGYGTITGGTPPYTTVTPNATVQGSIVKFPGFVAFPNNPTQITKAVTITDASGCTATQNITVYADVQPMYHNFLVTYNHTTCNGVNDGSITASVNPFIMPSPYTPILMYKVSGVGIPTGSISKQLGTPVNNLPSGTYTVESPDFACWIPDYSTPPNPNGRIITKTVIINTCQPLTASITVLKPAICTAKGSAKVVATGASGNYTYSWNTTPVQTTAIATGLAVGDYICMVTSGSSTPLPVNVNIPQTNTTLNVTITPKPRPTNPRAVDNNTIEVKINNAVPPANTYTYLWSTGATTPSIDLGYKMAQNNSNVIAIIPRGGGTPQPPVVTAPATKTTYTVTVTDTNGCTGTASYQY